MPAIEARMVIVDAAAHAVDDHSARADVDGVRPPVHDDERFGVLHGEGAHEDRIHEAEDRRVGADPEAEREDREGAEAFARRPWCEGRSGRSWENWSRRVQPQTARVSSARRVGLPSSRPRGCRSGSLMGPSLRRNSASCSRWNSKFGAEFGFPFAAVREAFEFAEGRPSLRAAFLIRGVQDQAHGAGECVPLRALGGELLFSRGGQFVEFRLLASFVGEFPERRRPSPSTPSGGARDRGEPVSTCRRSSEVRWMCLAMAWPWAGPVRSVRRIRTSSVPWRSSTRDG